MEHFQCHITNRARSRRLLQLFISAAGTPLVLQVGKIHQRETGLQPLVDAVVHIGSDVGLGQRILRRLACLGDQQSRNGIFLHRVHRAAAPAVGSDDFITQRIPQNGSCLYFIGLDDGFQQVEGAGGMPLHLTDTQRAVIIGVDAAVLALVGIDDFHGSLHHLPHRFVGGSQQRDGRLFPCGEGFLVLDDGMIHRLAPLGVDGAQHRPAVFHGGVVHQTGLFIVMILQHILVGEQLQTLIGGNHHQTAGAVL